MEQQGYYGRKGRDGQIADEPGRIHDRRVPLDRDAQALSEALGMSCEIVLLGSIATPKYVEPLLHIFGQRLVFPAEFVGRGDMSRGGLLLRCAVDKTELPYVSVVGAVRSGKRPPKLTPRRYVKSVGP